MKVRITYHDFTSLTKEEVIRAAKQNYGDGAEVEIFPSSNDPWDAVYFGLQQAITYDQLGLLFDEGALYPQKLEVLKALVLERLEKELNAVITDNEVRVS
jgi:hypothetical protein